MVLIKIPVGLSISYAADSSTPEWSRLCGEAPPDRYPGLLMASSDLARLRRAPEMRLWRIHRARGAAIALRAPARPGIPERPSSPEGPPGVLKGGAAAPTHE